MSGRKRENELDINTQYRFTGGGAGAREYKITEYDVLVVVDEGASGGSPARQVVPVGRRALAAKGGPTGIPGHVMVVKTMNGNPTSSPVKSSRWSGGRKR